MKTNLPPITPIFHRRPIPHEQSPFQSMDHTMRQKLSNLITDFEFEKIELSLKEPNIFRALAIERREIRHSNFIGYLLDPSESHGLGHIFLKKTLRDIFSDIKSDRRTIFDVDSLNLEKVEIRREWRNIDITIILNNDIIALENKIDAMDSQGQLKKYQETLGEFQNHNKHLVFLTPFGLEPNDKDADKYIIYSYEQISNNINTIANLYKNNISNKVSNYLADYQKILTTELLMTDELNEIAARIYNNHRAALDFILENRPDPAKKLYPYFEEVATSKGYVVASRSKGYIRFLTKELCDIIPANGMGWPLKEAFLFEINYYWREDTAILSAVISPGDETTRSDLMEAIKESKYFQQPQGKKWLQIYRERSEFKSEEMINEDEDAIKKAISKIFEKSQAAIKDISDKIETSLRSREKSS